MWNLELLRAIGNLLACQVWHAFRRLPIPSNLYDADAAAFSPFSSYIFQTGNAFNISWCKVSRPANDKLQSKSFLALKFKNITCCETYWFFGLHCKITDKRIMLLSRFTPCTLQCIARHNTCSISPKPFHLPFVLIPFATDLRRHRELL